MTAEEHKRTSIFSEQLKAARRSVSPPAGRSEDAPRKQHEADEGSEDAAARTAASTRHALQPAAVPRKQRSLSLPPAQRRASEHHLFDDDITWWRCADAGALNAPPARQTARAATAEEAPPKMAAERLADEVEAAERGDALPATPPVWRDETGALHRAHPHA